MCMCKHFFFAGNQSEVSKVVLVLPFLNGNKNNVLKVYVTHETKWLFSVWFFLTISSLRHPLEMSRKYWTYKHLVTDQGRNLRVWGWGSCPMKLPKPKWKNMKMLKNFIFVIMIFNALRIREIAYVSKISRGSPHPSADAFCGSLVLTNEPLPSLNIVSTL